MSKVMIQSSLNGNVIDIKGDPTQELDAQPPAVSAPSLNVNDEPAFAANQTWEVLRDPAGSTHYIIKNPATEDCIDILDASLKPGAGLHLFRVRTSDNENQLWDFLPDPFNLDSGCCFIQNPQTGYVIDIKDGSSASGASLVVNPRRLFDNNRQLWSAYSFSGVTFPSLTLAGAATSGSGPSNQFGSNNQYVILPTTPGANLTSVAVTIEIIEDLVADSFSIQINGVAPSPSGAPRFAQWMQYALLMQNNSFQLWNQVWHAFGPDPTPMTDPLESEPATSPSLPFPLHNSTVPAGTRIVLTLIIDSSNDYVTGVQGQIFDGTGPLTEPVKWSVVGQVTSKPKVRAKVKESDLAPFGALSVVVVGPPSGTTNFSSGMGTLTVTCKPDVTVSLNLFGPDPLHGIQTAEQSNCYYGQVQEGSFKQIVQPFGVLTPRITEVEGVVTVSGTGLYPNSNLTGTAKYTALGSGEGYDTIEGVVNAYPSEADGSFSFGVLPPNDDDFIVNYRPGTLHVTVKDSEGNSAWGNIAMGGTPKLIDGGGTPRTNW